MFKKVLVADDIDSINHAVTSVLRDLNIENVEYAQYCDKAYIKAKKAMIEGFPFDLLICDLSFKADHREERIKGGKELIAIVKEMDPNLKVLVNSIEDHPHTVKTLWESGNIEAYVCKDRNGMRELHEAIRELASGNTYNSPRINRSLRQENLTILDELEIKLLTYISQGLTQDEIQEKFKEENITPSSKSAIEKRLKDLRENFNAKTTPHLIGIVKDLKLI